MSDKKTDKGILVRKVQFEFPENFNPYWNPAKPVLSQLQRRPPCCCLYGAVIN